MTENRAQVNPSEGEGASLGEAPSAQPAAPRGNALAIDTDPSTIASPPEQSARPALEPPATIRPSSTSPAPTPSASIPSSVHTPTEWSSSAPWTPTRIAPPSPAASRRASGNLSRGRSRAGSATSAATGSSSAQSSGFAHGHHGQERLERSSRARPPSTLIPQPGDETVPPREEHALSHELVQSPQPHEQARTEAAADADTPVTATPHMRLPPRHQVIIRDFGFAPGDERYHGIRPPDVSTPASAASSEAALGGGGSMGGAGAAGASRGHERRKSSFGGWGGFSLGGFGWGSLRGLKKRDGAAGEDDGDADVEPEEVMSPSGSSAVDAPIALDLDDDEDSLLDDDAAYPPEDDLYDPPPGPEPHGLHRVVYAFEAVGQYEISVDEGEVLDVSGRGGGLGWVLAKRVEGNRGKKELDEGLVPESYIEAVRGEEQE